jgi:Phosphotransferase enzyme family
MPSSPQFDRDRFRVLVFRKEISELLVQETVQGCALPSLEIPSHSRVAEELTTAIETLWGLSVYCLFDLPNGSTAEQFRYQVAELQNTAAEAPTQMRWASTILLNGTDFANHADFAALQAAFAAFDLYRFDKPLTPFTKPGWLAEVAGWVAAEAAALGLEFTGKVRQLNASPTFSLIRFETNGPALWFKAAGEPHRHEYGITLELAERLPRHVPRLVASRPEWNAWLSTEVEGTHLAEGSPTSDWINAAAALADLQIASFGNGLHLIESGCKDVRASSLLERIDPFFSGIAPLMMAQTKQTPAPLTERELATLATDVRKALEELLRSNVPDVLGHLDCNPGNIVVSRSRTVFLDWAEGCVGHPFFTFQYLLEHWRKFHGRYHREEETFVSVYTNPWNCFLSARSVAADLPWIPLLAAFAYAASGSALSRAAAHPGVATFLRSITRRMKREADALRKERLACVR